MTRGSSDWRTCIDFGTAASKASTCTTWDRAGALARHVHPLRLGAVCKEPNPFVAESALLFDDERILFGWYARQRASTGAAGGAILHSFKTFLAAPDLVDSLNLKLRRSIDKSGRFTQRDALTMYVAYLLAVTDRAMRDDPSVPREALGCTRRFAYPVWRNASTANAILAAIFDEAAAVNALFGEALLDPNGVEADAMLRALDAAAHQPGDGRIEAGVYEAQAAAECHFAYTRGLPHHVMVFDMGAGTTDITSFEISESANGHTMREIANARRTFLLACDEVDKLLISFISDRAKVSGPGRADRLWRYLALRRHKLKETLFSERQLEFTWEQKRIVVKLSDFARDSEFRAFCKAVEQNFRFCLTQVELRAAAAGYAEVGIVLAGGGASLPFVQAMAKKARPSVRGIKRLEVQPLVPTWVQDPNFAQLGSIFPQVSISIGGAVAQVQESDLVRA